MIHRYLVLLAITLFIWGCAASTPSNQYSNQNPEKNRSSSATSKPQGMAFDPLALGSDLVNDSIAKSPATDAANPKSTTAGYRVQLGAYIEEKAAIREMESAKRKFDIPIYLQFDSPFHRIRIGDFKTMQQADSLKKIAMKQGYHDAVVTNDEIEIHK